MYVIPSLWWKEWCRYVQFQIPEMSKYATKQSHISNAALTHSRMGIKNFNELVKGKRPNKINNGSLLSSEADKIVSDLLHTVPPDAWLFLSSWYEADFKIKVKMNSKASLMNQGLSTSIINSEAIQHNRQHSRNSHIQGMTTDS